MLGMALLGALFLQRGSATHGIEPERDVVVRRSREFWQKTVGTCGLSCQLREAQGWHRSPGLTRQRVS